MVILSEWAGPPVEWAGLPVSPTLPYLRVSKLCLMGPGTPNILGKRTANAATQGIKTYTSGI